MHIYALVVYVLGGKGFLSFPIFGAFGKLEMKINHIDAISFHQTHKLTNSKIKICKAMRYLFCFFFWTCILQSWPHVPQNCQN